MKKLSYFIFAVLLSVISCTVEKEDVLSEKPLSVAKATAFEHSHLTYRGNNMWSGNTGAKGHAYFYGATPQEIVNGKRSSWRMVIPVGDPTYYQRSGIKDYGGDGDGFYTTTNCGTLPKIDRVLVKLRKNTDGSYTIVLGTVYTNYGQDGDCTFNGKIALDANCLPIIVDVDSEIPNGCLEDEPYIED